MKLVSKSEVKVTEVYYTLDTSVGQVYYKEWQDERGRVIDSEITDTEGRKIDDDELLTEIEEYVDTLD